MNSIYLINTRNWTNYRMLLWHRKHKNKYRHPMRAQSSNQQVIFCPFFLVFISFLICLHTFKCNICTLFWINFTLYLAYVYCFWYICTYVYKIYTFTFKHFLLFNFTPQSKKPMSCMHRISTNIVKKITTYYKINYNLI